MHPGYLAQPCYYIRAVTELELFSGPLRRGVCLSMFVFYGLTLWWETRDIYAHIAMCMRRWFSISSHDNLNLVIPNKKTTEH